MSLDDDYINAGLDESEDSVACTYSELGQNFDVGKNMPEAKGEVQGSSWFGSNVISGFYTDKNGSSQGVINSEYIDNERSDLQLNEAFIQVGSSSDLSNDVYQTQDFFDDSDSENFEPSNCNSCSWLPPLIVLVVAVSFTLVGISCSLKQCKWFSLAPQVFIPVGILSPFVALVLIINYYRPSKRKRLSDDFYSDALLEEIISGESILETYTITSPEGKSKGTIVFLSGIGSVPETCRDQVDNVVDSGYTAIIIQLPGSGCLSAVTFSFSRAERIVMKILQDEIFKGNQCFDDASISVSDMNDDQVSMDEENMEQNSNKKVLLVGFGIGSLVVMHLCAFQRFGAKHLAGVVLSGSTLLPYPMGWFKRLLYASYRVPWISEAVKWTEYAYMSRDTRRLVSPDSLNPGARADLVDEFNKWCIGLRASAIKFDHPVLCISGNESYLYKMRTIWALAYDHNKLETVHITGLGTRGSISYYRKKASAHNRCLLDFANNLAASGCL